MPALDAAAPEPLLEISAEDAAPRGLADGDFAEVESRRSRLRVRVRLASLAPGAVFLPFHYGTWDTDGDPRAANELTLTAWDPVSKQPSFKTSAVSVKRVPGPGRSRAAS